MPQIKLSFFLEGGGGISCSMAWSEFWEWRRTQRCGGSLCHLPKMWPGPWKQAQLPSKPLQIPVATYRKTNIACFECSIWAPTLLAVRKFSKVNAAKQSPDCSLRQIIKQDTFISWFVGCANVFPCLSHTSNSRASAVETLALKLLTPGENWLTQWWNLPATFTKLMLQTCNWICLRKLYNKKLQANSFITSWKRLNILCRYKRVPI
jgi:hypothetical protein